MSEITLDYNKLSDFEQYNLIKKLYEFENCKEEYSFSENKKTENNFDSFMSKKIKELKEKPITITKETYDYLKDSYIKSNVFWSLGKAVFESYKDNFTEDKRILTGCLKSSEDFNSWIDKNKEKDYNLFFISNDKNSSTVINSILNNIPENKRVMLRKDKIFLENEFTENNYESKEININQLCKLCIDEAQRKNDKVVNEWKERFNSELNEYIPAIRHVKILNEYLERLDNSIQENLDKIIESQLNGGMDDFLIEKEIEYNHMIESEEESEEESEILTDEEIAFLDDFNKKTKDMNMKIINKHFHSYFGSSELSFIDYSLECDDFTHKRLMDHLDSSYTPKKSKLNNDNEIPMIEFRKSLHPERFPDQILVGYFKKSSSGNEIYDCSTVDDSFTKDITRMINETCNEYDNHKKEDFNNIYKKMEKTGYKLNDYEKNIYNNFCNNLDELEYQKNLLNANYYIKYATSKLNNLNKENQENLFNDFKKETGLNAELLMNTAEKACPDLPESQQLKLTGEDWWRKALNHAMTSGGETYIDPNKAIKMLEKNYIIPPGSYENNFEDYFDNGKYADILSDNIFEVIKNSNEPGLIGFCNKDLDLNPLKSKTETLNHSSEIFKSSAENILNQPENQLKKLEHEIFNGLDELEKNNVTSMTMEHISFIKEAVKEKINNNTNTNESTHKGGRK